MRRRAMGEMKIKWPLEAMAGSYLKVSDNVKGGENPIYSLRSTHGAPETRAAAAGLAKQKGPHEPRTSRKLQKIMAPSILVNRRAFISHGINS